MFFFTALFVLLPLVSAYPLQRRAITLCGQFDTVEHGPYVLLTNLWGKSEATSGSQCSTLESVEDDTVRWKTYWSWTGDRTIKSFSNVQLNAGINRQLGTITSMHSTWNWSQENKGTVVADVAYDLFTSDIAGGPNANEIMIWVGKFNAEPLSSEYSEDGKALPIANNLTIGDDTWGLYSGTNGYNPVYSFVPTKGNISSFSGDLYNFFVYLIDNGHVNSWEYLVTAQAGTEATSGTAVLETTTYSLTIN